jgi:hypothetical protein
MTAVTNEAVRLLVSKLAARRPEPAASDAGHMLRVWSAGFHAYVIDQHEVHVCGLDVPTWPHAYGMIMDEQMLASIGQAAPFVVADGFAELLLDGWDISFGTGIASQQLTRRHGRLRDGLPVDPQRRESWEILELIPDVEDFCVGAKLASNWPSRPGITSRVSLSGGVLSVVPSKHTFEVMWSWNGQNGVEFRQPIADIVKCEVPVESAPVITATSRETGAVYHVPLAAANQDVDVFVLGFPIDWNQNLPPEEEYRLEVAHVHATLGICDVATDVRCVINATPHEIPASQRPRDPGPDPFVDIMRPGKINCTGRKLYTW